MKELLKALKTAHNLDGRFKTQHNYIPTVGYKNQGQSMTVPNMSMTIEDMLIRFNNGQAVPMSNNFVWEDDGEHFVIKDLTDLDEINSKLGRLKNKIETAQADLKRNKENQAKYDKKHKVSEDKPVDDKENAIKKDDEKP